MTPLQFFLDKEEIDELFYEELEARIILKHGEIELLKIRYDCKDELVLIEPVITTRREESIQSQIEVVCSRDKSHTERLMS